jgi:hypothetical protein
MWPRITVLLILLSAIQPCAKAADDKVTRLLLQVDESSAGPMGNANAKGCLRIYSDGKAVFVHRSRNGLTTTDESGRITILEQRSSIEFQLSEFDVGELDRFLHSGLVLKLASEFKSPHEPIDYFERTVVRIPNSNTFKRISTREYSSAELEEKAKYPSPLIVLLDQIAEIEQEALAKGKPVPIPSDCEPMD